MKGRPSESAFILMGSEDIRGFPDLVNRMCCGKQLIRGASLEDRGLGSDVRRQCKRVWLTILYVKVSCIPSPVLFSDVSNKLGDTRGYF